MQAELDFRNEAANLTECSKNMQARGFEPQLVRIPRVLQTELCTKQVSRRAPICTQLHSFVYLFLGQSASVYLHEPALPVCLFDYHVFLA